MLVRRFVTSSPQAGANMGFLCWRWLPFCTSNLRYGLGSFRCSQTPLLYPRTRKPSTFFFFQRLI